ncbi:unnamed protein product [Paramecium octaurelia]|uniref:Transmembrane protein n=1 Tax=Paramecium octaurelia TaxID=43137 RepID=A0A8S1VX20_PAROT|nr:unnamed protein product [Paramecium octaurelia]
MNQRSINANSCQYEQNIMPIIVYSIYGITLIRNVSFLRILQKQKFHQYTKIKQRQTFYLYPTEGEFYQNYLSDSMSNYEITCKMHPQVPNVQLKNQVFRTKGNKFISLSSNNTHFGTLSNNNEVVIYQWKNQIIQQVGQSVHIESSFNCFNINLSKDFSILIDCYYNDEFILIQLIDSQSIIAYSIQSQYLLRPKYNQQ